MDIKKDLKITNVQLEILVGVLHLYSLIGSFAAGRTSDRIGRRLTMGFATAIFFAGSWALRSTTPCSCFMVGRFVESWPVSGWATRP